MTIAIKCPSCSANLQVPDDVEFVICEYCSCTVKVREIVRIETDYDVPEWMKIADNAYRGENFEEAYEYYNMVLEKESHRSKAWIGKGFSAGRLSDDNDHRFDEMLQLVKYGLSITNEKDIAEEKSSVKKELLSIMQDYFSNIKKDKFATDYEFNDYVNEGKPFAKACGRVYDEFFTGDIIFSKFYCLVIRSFLQKHIEYGAETRTVFQISEPERTEYKNRLIELEKEIKAVDKNYITYNETERKKTLKKFIITGAAVAITALIVLYTVKYFNSISENESAKVEREHINNVNKPAAEYELLNKAVKNKRIIYTVYTSTESLNDIQRFSDELIKRDEPQGNIFIINFFSDKNDAKNFAGIEISLKKNSNPEAESFSAIVKYTKGKQQKELYYYEKSKLIVEKF